MSTPRLPYFLILTILLPLHASAEMLLTSSWTLNYIDDAAPTGLSVGQAYTVTVRYDETAIPVYSAPVDRWDFLESTMTMTLSIPEVGIELSSPGYASLSGGDSHSLGFYSYFVSDTLGEPLTISLTFSDVSEEIFSEFALPTDTSQLPMAPTLLLIRDSFSADIQLILGGITEQPTTYLDPFFINDSLSASGPFVGFDGPFLEAPSPLDIDLGTATLTLEQVPEPATWALAGGVLALGTSILIRRRR